MDELRRKFILALMFALTGISNLVGITSMAAVLSSNANGKTTGDRSRQFKKTSNDIIGT